MAKVKVEVQDAVVDGKGKGTTLEIEEASAKHLEAIGYVKSVPASKAKASPKAKPKASEKSEAKSSSSK